MAYIKFKELTKYFNFNKKIEIGELPKYVLDYVLDNEEIIAAYRTSRDRAVFTDKRMILFDVTPYTRNKKIHILPYKNISTSAIMFGGSKAKLLISFDSGYQLRLDFSRMSPDDKKSLRLLYTEMTRIK